MYGIVEQDEYIFFVQPNKVFYFKDLYRPYKEFYGVESINIKLGPKELVKWTE